MEPAAASIASLFVLSLPCAACSRHQLHSNHIQTTLKPTAAGANDVTNAFVLLQVLICHALPFLFHSPYTHRCQ
jgi:hypothetical protein